MQKPAKRYSQKGRGVNPRGECGRCKRFLRRLYILNMEEGKTFSIPYPIGEVCRCGTAKVDKEALGKIRNWKKPAVYGGWRGRGETAKEICKCGGYMKKLYARSMIDIGAGERRSRLVHIGTGCQCGEYHLDKERLKLLSDEG